MTISATAYDFTDGVTYGVPVDALRKVFVLQNELDCTVDIIDVSVQTEAKLFLIKEGWFVWNVWYVCTKVASAASVINCIGDAAGSNTWVDTNSSALTTLGVSGGGIHSSDTDPVLNGKLYTANDYIYASFATQDFDGKIKFSALVVDLFGGLTLV